MAFTYDPTTDIGRVRRSIPDKKSTEYVWEDDEIQSFLDDEGGNWRLATAFALETMASDDVLILKVVKIQNIETNADRIASALYKRAALLREQARLIDSGSDSDSSTDFAVAEVIVNDFQYNEKVFGIR